MKPTDHVHIFALVQKVTCFSSWRQQLFSRLCKRRPCNTTKRRFFLYQSYFVYIKDPIGVPFFPIWWGLCQLWIQWQKTNIDGSYCRLVLRMKLSLSWFCGWLLAGYHNTTAGPVSWRWSKQGEHEHHSVSESGFFLIYIRFAHTHLVKASSSHSTIPFENRLWRVIAHIMCCVWLKFQFVKFALTGTLPERPGFLQKRSHWRFKKEWCHREPVAQLIKWLKCLLTFMSHCSIQGSFSASTYPLPVSLVTVAAMHKVLRQYYKKKRYATSSLWNAHNWGLLISTYHSCDELLIVRLHFCAGTALPFDGTQMN